MKTYKSQLRKLRIVEEKTEILNTKITSSKDSYAVIKEFYESDITIYESFFILLLNRVCNTTGYAKISQGGISGTVIDTKIIAKYAVESLASAVIIAHNHPSGNPAPSQSDIAITKKIKTALATLDVTLLDHIILTNETFYSMADQGILYF